MIFKVNIENATQRNRSFRRVIYTAKKMQLVLMSLKPGEEIDLEKHDNIDQFIRIEKGTGRAYEGRKQRRQKYYSLKDGDAIVIPAGTWHRVKNTSSTDNFYLYTIYSPPEHYPGTHQKEKPVTKRRRIGK